jgi:2-keto-4-pentenoate hydratase/2-oxohepta-3-ene-1,7-dioic acid hydratase in catechol pathway
VQVKFVTFQTKRGVERAGWLHSEGVVDMNAVSNALFPDTMSEFLLQSEELLPLAKQWTVDEKEVIPFHEIQLRAPLPTPGSFRDFYAFEEHVKTARRNRGLEVEPVWYDIPVFYFSNHRAIVGPNENILRPRKCNRLDYELEIACVIGKKGRNIKASEAEDYIFGYCVLNDWSARDIQMQEVKAGLGPAKGKDFATSIGPYLVTKDELEPYRTDDRYDLEMKATVNGTCLSKGNFKSIYYSFAQMIERASDDATLYPGDLIGSGTVGTGCILELGTDVHRWLAPGDEVELEITGLGKLRNRII